MAKNVVKMNRAPVLTLWGAVVAERLGFEWEAALTLSKVMTGLNAAAKGRALGMFGEPKPPERRRAPKQVGLGEDLWVDLCGRNVPAKNTEDGIRGCVKDQVADPAKVQKYLTSKFKDDLDRVRAAMTGLAASFAPDELNEYAFELYEKFRPQIASGKAGWGQKGDLDLDLVRSLANKI